MKKEIIINGHEAVDLGRSVNWATCNIGATKPEECGNYFAWGETSPKDVYTKKPICIMMQPIIGSLLISEQKSQEQNTMQHASNGEMIGECLLKKNCMNCLETVYGNGLP